MIRYHIDAIFEKCFKVKNASVNLNFSEPLEPTMYRLCKDDNTLNRFQELIPSQFAFLQDQDVEDDQERAESNRESALMVIHWIG